MLMSVRIPPPTILDVNFSGNVLSNHLSHSTILLSQNFLTKISHQSILMSDGGIPMPMIAKQLINKVSLTQHMPQKFKIPWELIDVILMVPALSVVNLVWLPLRLCSISLLFPPPHVLINNVLAACWSKFERWLPTEVDLKIVTLWPHSYCLFFEPS